MHPICRQYDTVSASGVFFYAKRKAKEAAADFPTDVRPLRVGNESPQNLQEPIDYHDNLCISTKQEGLPPAMYRQQALLAA